MTTLEEKKWQIESPSLIRLKVKFPSTLRNRADCSELSSVFPNLGLLPNHNPSPTVWAGDARARNAIGHIRIIGRSGS